MIFERVYTLLLLILPHFASARNGIYIVLLNGSRDTNQSIREDLSAERQPRLLFLSEHKPEAIIRSASRL